MSLEKTTKYGIQPRHVMEFIPVSRMTAHKWLRGGNPTPFLRDQVAALTTAILTAAKNKDLPVSNDLTMQDKDPLIMKAIRKYLGKGKPRPL